jgi:NhaA family Na+:H+ antiporter
VAYIILPLFAFANAGINFSNFTLHSFTNAIPLGIVLGLVLGKPVGITLFTFITQKLTKAKMTISWLDVLIIGFFAGIGFTMSLFIASLSFGNNLYWLDLSRLGILLASVIAALTASLLTIFYKKKLQ